LQIMRLTMTTHAGIASAGMGSRRIWPGSLGASPRLNASMIRAVEHWPGQKIVRTARRRPD
jgi:hypothetical protein